MTRHRTATDNASFEDTRMALAKVQRAKSELESLRNMTLGAVDPGEINYWMGGINRWEKQLKRRLHELVDQ